VSTRTLLADRAAIVTEMRTIHAAHPDGALPTDAEARFNVLKADLAGMDTRIDRQALLDDADRRTAGSPVATAGTDARFDAEIRNFSLVRALAGAAGIQGVDAGREREISAEVARRSGRSFEGIAVPLAALERRVFTTAAPSGGPGSNLIQTDVRTDLTIPQLLAATKVRQLGATVLSGLIGNVSIPRIKASPSVAWVAENAALTASDPQVDAVSLSPKTAGSLLEISRTMLLQTASPGVEDLLRSTMAANLALALDAAAISGPGTGNAPTGILSQSGIGSVAMGTNGAALTYAAVADLQGAVADVNAETGSVAFLSNTKVRRAAAKIVDSQARPLGLPVVFQNLPTAWTNLVPATLTKGSSSGDCSALIYGNWSDLLIGLWSELDVLVNPFESTAYSKGNVQVRAMMTCDIAVRHAASFAAILDVLA
jgi:HK97 family phage major capsid protein